MDDGNKKSSVQSVEVVEEIIEEDILTRVSVKSALRLRCVSKSWRSLIDNRRFIKKHLQNSSRQRLIINDCSEERIFVQCSRFYLGEDKPSHCPIDDQPADTSDSHYILLQTSILLGHCNGLLCVFELLESSCFFLWNPATRVNVKLPKIEHDEDKNIKYGFGWDEQSGAYKVFVSDNESIARVYSSKTNSWTTVERGCDSLVNGFGVFAYGKIHWITGSGHIESFDLKGDVFETTMIKQPGEGGCAWLWEWRGRLYMVRSISGRRRVWLMKKNEDEDEFRWVEDEQANSLLDRGVCGSYGAFSYIETLVSPPLVQNNTTQ